MTDATEKRHRELQANVCEAVRQLLVFEKCAAFLLQIDERGDTYVVGGFPNHIREMAKDLPDR